MYAYYIITDNNKCCIWQKICKIEKYNDIMDNK